MTIHERGLATKGSTEYVREPMLQMHILCRFAWFVCSENTSAIRGELSSIGIMYGIYLRRQTRITSLETVIQSLHTYIQYNIYIFVIPRSSDKICGTATPESIKKPSRILHIAHARFPATRPAPRPPVRPDTVVSSLTRRLFALCPATEQREEPSECLPYVL